MAQRRRAAALATIIVVGVIALVWILSLSLSFTNFFNTEPRTTIPENTGIEAPY